MSGLLDFVVAMPKVELHVHLEGSISPARLLTLAERNGIALGLRNAAEVEAFYRYRDFAAFLRVFMSCVRCIRQPQDIYDVTRDLLDDARRQNVLYSEVLFSPQHYLSPRLPLAAILEAIGAARREARRDWGTGMNLILDISRDAGPDAAELAVDWAIAGQDRGVVGLGIGGSEANFPPALFARSFARARAAGLRLTAHAGEAAGPESIVAALDRLGVERIGHGVRCVEDAVLVERLLEQAVTLEMCPTSNVLTRVVPTLDAHPVADLLRQGLRVTLNTDDPPMFNTDLVREYACVVAAFGLGRAELRKLVDNAVAGAFLDHAERASLEARLAAAWAPLCFRET